MSTNEASFLGWDCTSLKEIKTKELINISSRNSLVNLNNTIAKNTVYKTWVMDYHIQIIHWGQVKLYSPNPCEIKYVSFF